MLFKDAPAFATVGPAPKKVRFAKTRKNKTALSTRKTRKFKQVPEQPKMTAIEALWESYKSAVATITHLTKSSVY
jgi:hypothetical protein